MIDMQKWQQLAAEHIHDRPSMPGRLKGKIAMITGGAQGIGLELARAMIREGAQVMLADISADAVQAAAGSLGENAAAVHADVSSEEDVAAMIGAAVERFGGLDLFVNNAGIVRSGSLSVLEKSDFDLVTRVNYSAYFLCVKYASAVMRAEHEADPAWTGDIIEINSKSGLEGSNRNSAYSGSKFGGIGLTQSFALELCPSRIKVNAICPGNYLDGALWSDPEKGLFVQYLKAGKVPGAETPADVRRYYEARVPMGRGVEPEDLARALFYLVEQQYETGQALPVTGGQTMIN